MCCYGLLAWTRIPFEAYAAFTVYCQKSSHVAKALFNSFVLKQRGKAILYFENFFDAHGK